MLSATSSRNPDSHCFKQWRSVLFHVTGSPGQSGLQNELPQWLSPGLLKDPCSHQHSCVSSLKLASSAFWQQDGHSSLGPHVQTWQCLHRKGNAISSYSSLGRLKSFSRSTQISLHVSLPGIRSHNPSWTNLTRKMRFSLLFSRSPLGLGVGSVFPEYQATWTRLGFF